MDDLHVVAALMPGGKFAVELLVGLAQEGESDAREDDTPAIGRVGGILLVDADLVARIVNSSVRLSRSLSFPTNSSVKHWN